jgi:hypothetical protein
VRNKIAVGFALAILASVLLIAHTLATQDETTTDNSSQRELSSGSSAESSFVPTKTCGEALVDTGASLVGATDHIFGVHSTVSINESVAADSPSCILQVSFNIGGEKYTARWSTVSPQSSEVSAISIVACQVDDDLHIESHRPCVLDGVDEGVFRTNSGFTVHKATASGDSICEQAFSSEMENYYGAIKYTYKVNVSYNFTPLGDPKGASFVCIVQYNFQQYNGNRAPMLSSEWLMYPNRSGNRRVAIGDIACDMDVRRKHEIVNDFFKPNVLEADNTEVECRKD